MDYEISMIRVFVEWSEVTQMSVSCNDDPAHHTFRDLIQCLGYETSNFCQTGTSELFSKKDSELSAMAGHAVCGHEFWCISLLRQSYQKRIVAQQWR